MLNEALALLSAHRFERHEQHLPEHIVSSRTTYWKMYVSRFLQVLALSLDQVGSDDASGIGS